MTPIAMASGPREPPHPEDDAPRPAPEADDAEAWRVDFRALAAFAPVGIFQTNARGDCVFVNPRWCDMAGMTPEEARGSGWARALHPDDRERVARVWYEGVARGDEFESDYRFRRPDGRVTWLQGRARPLRDAGGGLAGYLGTVTDVTERKLAEERLRILTDATRVFAHASEPAALLRAIARQMGEALGPLCTVMLVSEDGARLEAAVVHHRDEEARAAIQQMLDAFPVAVGEGLIGQVVATGESLLLPRVSPEDLLPRVKPEHRAAVERWPPRSVLITPLRAAGAIVGAVSLARHDDVPYTNEDRLLVEDLAERAALAFTGLTLLAREQAARRALEGAGERLRVALGAAEAAGRAKDEFLAMLGHELRNPLSPILTALHLMRLRGGDALLRERAIIERQVRHLIRLVDDLLDVSRFTRGRVELDRRPIEIAQVVAKSVEMASPLIEERKHRLVTRVPASGLVVLGDEHRLAQVVSNLLTNAAKYTEPGGTIEIDAAPRGGVVALRVRDTGVGIAPELLPRVFDLFVQGQRTIERSQGGLGLGLAIVRSLVELHGGTIAASSEGLGRGSEFTVELPLVGPDAARPRAASEAPRANSALRGAGRRVLVVDDNRDAALGLAEALEASGYAADVAFDGPSALALAAERFPDAALIDIGLPGLDGYEVARRLRGLHAARAGAPPLLLIALTGYGQEADRQRSAAAGFHDHLVKPVDVERILRRLDAAQAAEPP